ncbi:hypothetical protein B0A58_09745 [Flavobacterium branchiophilum NBRC 15030 = ATCC 35035]|uniref:Uncharacterized protein n=1 Tax=Flavobacterium branchiophilum TaxID=55197 RepID=A0A543G4P5_9FLAO|nr:hypothetical protein [Flavobacterium branchiophilum]OXA74895.1 hypothetical protein B0A58_09745 [Flavobacterium branchiophilum NBRC 15030 = ATCC 35035]TQM41063.1 hypothetical protein BC670_1995 [Flavobacterium branchiophilum]GEM54658.1 hypothetical protein FB1_08790 [Flavobacterium branchiophilum NBRC 15030 = ATCC 35035]
MNIDKTIKDRKIELLSYFRDRASEALTVIKSKFAETQSDKRARAINESLNQTKSTLITTILQQAEKEKWTNKEKLECILMVTYCNIVVMIESRNSVRPYEYMDFSRRVGELWDPFCKLCFYYPINDISLFIPPLFSEVKKKMTDEIADYIDSLTITAEEKQELKIYYDKVWSLVSSGEIQLELDLHFLHNDQKYVVDFKSGFGSNEKGNTNRLLLVATIYQNLDENYKCLLFVRAEENNSYFNTLKNSGIWEAYCGNEAYEKIKTHSGYDLKLWTDTNIDWANDFNNETITHFTDKNLLQYLLW